MDFAEAEALGPSENVIDRSEKAFWRPARTLERQTLGQNVVRAGVHNRDLVLHHVRANQPISRLELAELTGLTAPGIFKIAQELLKDKYLVASRKREGARGQPTSFLAINPDAAYSIGINVERGHIAIIVLDFAGQIRETFRREVYFPTPEQLKSLFGSCYAWLQRIHPQIAAKLTGIGISIADGVVPRGNLSLQERWRAVRLQDLFEEIVVLPVSVENNAAAAAIGEVALGAGKSVGSFFYLYIGASLGGGLVLNRRYVRGGQGRGCDLRPLPNINPFRPSTAALLQGLDTIVSTDGLLEALTRAGWLHSRIDHSMMTSPRFHAVACEWVRRAADLLYLPFLSAVCIADLDAICLGGNLPAALMELLAAEANKRLSMNLGVEWQTPIVRPSTVSGNAAAIGAAVLGFGELWD